MSGLEIVLEYLPFSLKQYIHEFLVKREPIPNDTNNHIEEIRLRNNKPLALKFEQGTLITDYNVSQQDVLQSFEKICESSVYSYRKQICNGYITINGMNLSVSKLFLP